MSRVVAFAEKLIETGWLLALIVVPLFLNVHSHRVFEPDKLGLLRTMVTGLAPLAAMVAVQGRARVPGQDSLRSRLVSLLHVPVVPPTLALVGVYLLTTAWSVAPRVSLLGSYQRLQGTYSMLCYVLLLAYMLICLRDREQMERVLTVIVVTSVPVSLYGILQHYGLDPLPWQGDVTRRVTSSMGNAIFVGAYLVMVIPITLGRLIESLRAGVPTGDQRAVPPFVWIVSIVVQVVAWLALSFVQSILVSLLLFISVLLLAQSRRGAWAPVAQAAICCMALPAQLVTLLYSASRGPQIGLLVGLVLFSLLSVAVARKRRVALSVVASGLILAALLLIMNLPASPLAAVRQVPYVGRLGRLLELDRGTGRVRTLIWEGALDLLRDDPLRAVIGYGPETLQLVYNRSYPAELAHFESRTATPDRSHNETFDALIMTGVPGLLAQLALMVSVFVHGLQALGMVPDRRARNALLALTAAGGALGIVLPALLDQSLRLAGVGLPLGLLAGILVYISARAILPGPSGISLEHWQQTLIIALLAAIAAHWIEISVGIAIAATRTYFWMYVALLVCVTRWAPPVRDIVPEAERHAPRGAARRSRDRGKHQAQHSPFSLRQLGQPDVRSATLTAAAMAVLLALVPITLTWDLLSNPDGHLSPLAILASALTARGGTAGIWHSGPLWLALAVLVATITAILASWRQQVAAPTARDAYIAGAVAIATPVLLTVLFAVGLALLLRPPLRTFSLLNMYLVVAALAWLVSAILMHRAVPAGRHTRQGQWIGYAAAWIALVVLAWHVNIRPIRADMIYSQGLAQDAGGNWERAAILYEQAAEMVPYEDYYLLYAGRARLEQARLTQDRTERDRLVQLAIAHLEEARTLSPLNPDHPANLARVYRAWAEGEADPARKQERLAQASELYAQAIELSPHNAQLVNEWGLTLSALGDDQRAEELYSQSLELDDQYAMTYLLLSDLRLEQQDWDSAIALLERATELDASSLAGWSRLAYAYAMAERWEEAASANEKVLQLAPDDFVSLRNLVYIYHTLGDDETALIYLDRAIAVAPEGQDAELRVLRQQLVPAP